MTMKTSKIRRKGVCHPSDQIYVHHHHHPHHHVPGLLQTSVIMASQSSLSSVIMMSSLLRDLFLVTKLFRLSVHFVRCLPLFPLYSIFACLVHQLSLYTQKTEVVLFLIVLSRNLLYPVISITSSFLFFSVHGILILLLM